MDAKVRNDFTEFVRRYWPEQAALPKHEKLRQAIATSIVEGYWAPGARLPAELEWVEATPCSLGTVQRALRTLVSDGFIRRRRGSGTVVTDLSRTVEEPWHMRFIDPKFPDRGYVPVTTRMVSRRIIRRKGPWSEAINQGSGGAVKIERVWTITGTIEAYSIFYALAGRFPELESEPLSSLNGTNFKAFIARRHHLPVHRVRQHMRFEDPPKPVTTNCHWPEGVTAAVLNVVAYSLDGEPMYYQDFYIPPSRFTLDLGTPTRR